MQRFWIGGLALLVALAGFVLWRTNQDPPGYRDGDPLPADAAPEPEPGEIQDPREALADAVIRRVQALGDDAELLRLEFEQVLTPEAIRPILVERLATPKRDAALIALGGLGGEDELLRMLGDERGGNHGTIARALLFAPPSPAVLDGLAPLLDHATARVRQSAAATLKELGAAAAAPVLAQANSPRRQGVLLVVDVLTALGPEAHAALRAALQENDPRRADVAAIVLARHGVETAAALPLLFRLAVRDSDLSDAGRAALDALKSVPADAAPAVRAALEDEAVEMRRLGALAASRMAADVPGEDELLALMLDEQAPTRQHALTALARMKSPEAATMACALLSSDDGDLRAHAAWTLDLLGVADETVRTALQPLLDDRSGPARAAATLAWRELFDDPQPARAAARAMIPDEFDPDLRAAGRAMIHDLGIDPTKELVASLPHAKGDECVAIARLLIAPGRDPTPYAGALEELARSERDDLRHAATFLLASCGRAVPLTADAMGAELLLTLRRDDAVHGIAALLPDPRAYDALLHFPVSEIQRIFYPVLAPRAKGGDRRALEVIRRNRIYNREFAPLVASLPDRAAAAALRVTGDEELWKRTLADRRPWLRRNAALALATNGDASGLAALADTDPCPSLRAFARENLSR